MGANNPQHQTSALAEVKEGEARQRHDAKKDSQGEIWQSDSRKVAGGRFMGIKGRNIQKKNLIIGDIATLMRKTR